MRKSELKQLILESIQELKEEQKSTGELQKLIVEISKLDIDTANKFTQVVTEELGNKLTPEVVDVFNNMFDIVIGLEDWD
jgi:hypothetical protein